MGVFLSHDAEGFADLDNLGHLRVDVDRDSALGGIIPTLQASAIPLTELPREALYVMTGCSVETPMSCVMANDAMMPAPRPASAA